MEWRDIPGFEGRYQVSNTGRVRSLDRSDTMRNRWGTQTEVSRKGRELRLATATNGYLMVNLGVGRRHLVHRLVAMAFIPGDTTLQVNHKNGRRADNSVENLEWMNCSDNHRHSYRELSRKRHGRQRLVVCVIDGKPVFIESVKAAARVFGVSPGSVSSAVLRNHLCKGMEVRYV